MAYINFKIWGLVILSCSALTLSSQDGLRPRGDVNCDWEVSIADINTLLDSILTGAKYHPFYGYTADINGDEEYSIADINVLISALLGDTLPPMPKYSGTLPVLFINTEGHHPVTSKEEYIHAKWWLDNMGLEQFSCIGSAQNPMGMEIKGHGNYTWFYCDKKSFRLKLDEKQEMLGMPSSRHWVIKANAYNWKGKIEDALPFEIGRRMGMAWNPHIEPLEVVFNGEYIGLYLLYEKIKVDKDRVNIIEQRNGETNHAKITGGWLLEIDNYIEPNNITFTEGNGKPFWVTPHSPEILSILQRNYITNLLLNANAAIYCKDKTDRSWEEYIDIDSLAIFYIVQEVVDNLEAFSGSCYMHKQRGDSTRLVFGPLWDCDHAFYRYSTDFEFNKFIYEDVPDNWYSRWIGEIAKFPHFQERVKHHWRKFYDEVYPAMDDFMEEFTAGIEEAGKHDYKRWPQYNSLNITARMRTYAKPSFHKKVTWLHSQWGE